jgi:hypothetical protein
MPLTKHLNVAIIDSNPALGSRLCFNKEDPPNPRVSTVTPASISLFKGINFDIFVIHALCHPQILLKYNYVS